MRFFLGLDGGGSHCRARVVDADGTLLGSGLAGTANTRIGLDASLAAMHAAWDEAIAEAGLGSSDVARIHAGVGVAGYKREGAAAAFEAAAHPFASIRFVSDAVIANLGAHGGGDGGTLIIGTGSIGIVRVGGTDQTFGGHGFPASDEGSGAWLGLEAMRHALLAHDGRVHCGSLAEALLDRFDRSPTRIVAWTDRATPTDYASLAPMIVEHARAGDAGAQAIIGQAAAIIAGFVKTLGEHGARTVCLMGGLGPVLEPWLDPVTRARIAVPRGDALDGALLLAGWRPA